MGQRVVGRLLGTVALAATLAVAGLGTATAAPTSGPGPVRRLVAAAEHRVAATHPRTGFRQALRVTGTPVVLDEDSYLGINPSCAKGSGKTRPNATVASTRKLTLDYALTGRSLHKTGKVTVKKDRETVVKLPKVRAGSYRLVLTEHGKGRVVADQTFEILHCVTTKARCHTLTFTNPAGNPDALVSYGRKRSEEFDVEVAAGTSRTVRVDDRKVHFSAVSAAEFADLGSATVKVRQSCKHGPAAPGQNAVQTVGVAMCATSSPAEVHLLFSAQASLKDRRWEVLDSQQRIVAHGSYKHRGHATASLPAGSYAYRSYANSSARPFEDFAFTVLGCVTVTPRCRALDVTNPNAVPLDLLLFPGDDDADPEDLEDLDVEHVIAASATTTVGWTARTASYLALPEGIDDDDNPVISLASTWSGDDFPEVTVPQTC